MNRDNVKDELIDLVKNGCKGKKCSTCVLDGTELQCLCNMINPF